MTFTAEEALEMYELPKKVDELVAKTTNIIKKVAKNQRHVLISNHPHAQADSQDENLLNSIQEHFPDFKVEMDKLGYTVSIESRIHRGGNVVGLGISNNTFFPEVRINWGGKTNG